MTPQKTNTNLFALLISSCGTMMFLIGFTRLAIGACPRRLEMSVGGELDLREDRLLGPLEIGTFGRLVLFGASFLPLLPLLNELTRLS